MPSARALRFYFYSFTIAQLISILGDRLHQFSVVGMIGKINPGDAVELYQLGLFSFLPMVLFAPLFGSLIDRTNKAVVLVVVDVIRGLLVLIVPTLFYLMGNLYAFYIPVFFLSLANLWFSPAKSAVIPEIFGDGDLLHVNAVLWGLGIVGTLIGFLLGGWLFDFHSWEMSFYADGASYLISVIFLVPLIFAVRAAQRTRNVQTVRPSIAANPQGLLASVRDSLGLIRNNRLVAYGLGVQTGLFGALGILYVIGIAQIQSVFPSDKTIYLSAVASAGTIGLLGGAGLITIMRRYFSVSPLVTGSTILFALSWAGVARTETLVPMIAWALVLGVSVSPLFILTETLLQVSTPQPFRGRIFSAREVTTKAAFLAMSSLATIAAAFVSKAVIMTTVGLVLAVLAILLASKNFLKA